jgi:hypothetical protein
MFGKKALYVASAVLLLAPVSAFGQYESPFQTGVREFTVVGSGSSDESFDNTALATSFSIGQFFTDHLEGAIRQEISFSDTSDNNDFNGSTRIAADYHFGSGRLVPLLGITVGYLYGDTVKEQFIAGPEAGLKFFMNATTFLYGLIEYQFLFEDADDVDEAYDDGRFVYSIGLGMTF